MIAMPEFANSYREARDRFYAVARAHNWDLHSYAHPFAELADGGRLSTDVALYGPRDAQVALLITSGTHGIEGFVGSAAQIAFIQALSNSVLPDVRIVLVHAVNPWGFEYRSRTNENNVDINRNFIDWEGGANPPANPDYDEIHPLLRLDAAEPDAPTSLEAWIRAYGRSRYFNAISKGQYNHPTGLMYGGSRTEWSNDTVRRILRDHLPEVLRLGFIDWHTGLGQPGEPFFLCFDDAGSVAWQRACRWWGTERLENNTAFGDAARPHYQGLLFQGVRRFMPQAEVAGAVIEFGTEPYERVLRAIRTDRLLKEDARMSENERRRLSQEMHRAFIPTSPAWRRRVLAQAVDIQRTALQGVLGWTT